ncbi:uncharacterized protein EV420DRAFT_258314 [Desarmillaria tabescens]|uniref:Uncharacterized protein n=1 Tax=Armillaria tabescens TaxID=1929756 RepID=A0AA39J5T0_ARMTA|nr:uncharacterized protein EV420DRAFT_258314 [Desarmillaria tabescens]KAK0436184.1 hypothetical protein EV420DRAFT_258314 [Desarmillaria tabescens]
MESEEAINLLFNASDLKEINNEINRYAKAIVFELGYIPLAIDLAGSSIQYGYYTIYDYLELFDKNRKERLTEIGLFEKKQNIYGAWNLSLKAIQSQAQKNDSSAIDAQYALKILELFAFFYNKNISEEIFNRAATTNNSDNNCIIEDSYNKLLETTESNKWNFKLFRKGISILLACSLIKKTEKNRIPIYFIHSLVHKWCLDRLQEVEKQSAFNTAIIIIAKSVPNKWNKEDYIFLQTLSLHLKDNILNKDIYIIKQFVKAFFHNGKWKDVERLELKVLSATKHALGEDHPDTLRFMSNLALTYWNQG